MRRVSDKIVEKIQTHILCSIVFFYRAVCEIVWKTAAERDGPQITIWRLLVDCWINKVTDTHSEYVTLTAFPLLQRLRERASMLRYTYFARLFFLILQGRVPNP
jgi:hypothetical protein